MFKSYIASFSYKRKTIESCETQVDHQNCKKLYLKKKIFTSTRERKTHRVYRKTQKSKRVEIKLNVEIKILRKVSTSKKLETALDIPEEHTRFWMNCQVSKKVA